MIVFIFKDFMSNYPRFELDVEPFGLWEFDENFDSIVEYLGA